MLSLYSQIYTLGHKYLADLFSGPVVIQEKIDGSFFSFGVIDGVLHCRSKGQQIQLDAAGMFAAAVATARRLFDSMELGEGVIYRCEYLSKPKHNVLAYARIPKGNLVLFDIETPGQHYFGQDSLASRACLFGLEPVPVLFSGDMAGLNPSEFIEAYLKNTSCLGGCKIEGVVIKNYNRFGSDGKILVGKFVSPAFKEVHRHEWRKDNPTKSDIVQQIIADYKTSPRYCKAIQHLSERGELVNAPQDIGKLINEIRADVLREEIDVIKDILFKHFWPQISRGIISGLPEWYRAKLAGYYNVTQGEHNAFFGPQAGKSLTTGDNNVLVGLSGGENL